MKHNSGLENFVSSGGPSRCRRFKILVRDQYSFSIVVPRLGREQFGMPIPLEKGGFRGSLNIEDLDDDLCTSHRLDDVGSTIFCNLDYVDYFLNHHPPSKLSIWSGLQSRYHLDHLDYIWNANTP